MPEFTTTSAFRQAQAQAFVDRLSGPTGSPPATVRLYDGPAGLLLARVPLAHPAGMVDPQGIVSLVFGAPEIVTASGTVAWGVICRHDGTEELGGNVLPAGTGNPVFSLYGADGTAQVFAGGRVDLEEVTVTPV